MSGHIDVYVYLVQFSNLLDHIDVQPHTLYKIARYHAEVDHRGLLENIQPTLHVSMVLGKSRNKLPPIFRFLRNSVKTN